jgi:hypothetical protein
MATIDLGRIKFKWQGAWSSSTSYVVDDVVESGGNSYVCIAASTNNVPPNATYWELMAQKGTDTSVLTTQGDVLYHDGSSLARLGAGTSGQVLQTGGSGANPSWGTLSNDYVKLASADTSGVSEVIFDNYFSSDYYQYKFIGSALVTNNGDRIDFNPRTSSGNQLANRYETATYNYREWNGGSATNISVDSNVNDTNGGRLGWGNTNTILNFEVLCSEPQNSSVYKIHYYQSASFDANYIYLRQGSTNWRTNTNAFTGFRFNQVDGRNCTWKITMYGIKK